MNIIAIVILLAGSFLGSIAANSARANQFTNPGILQDRKLGALHKIISEHPNNFEPTTNLATPTKTHTRAAVAPQIGIHFDAFTRFNTVIPSYGQTFPNAGSFGIGPNQIVTFSYYATRSFNKNGTPDNILDVSGPAFFSPVGTALPEDFLGDTISQFDPFSQRWFFVSNSNQPFGYEGPNYLYIAFSDGPIINALTKFTYYSFDVSQIPPATSSPTRLADYPKMGIDSQAIYIGYDEFDNLDPFFQDAGIFVLPKAQLFAGSPVINAFRELLTQYGTLFPTGVNNFDPNPEFGYVLSGNLFTQSDINLFTIIDPASATPSLSIEFIPINPIQVFLALSGQGAPQKGNLYGNNSLLEFLGAAFNSAFIRDNHLFAALDAAVDNTGNSNTPLADREGILWFELDLNTAPTSITQNGVIFDPSDVNPLWFIWAGIMGNTKGDLVIASSVTGADSFANMMIAARKATDPAGQMSAPVFVTDSQAPLNMGPNPDFSFGQQRFGEQTCVVLDPTDNLTIWAAAEWVAEQDNWASRIVQILPS